MAERRLNLGVAGLGRGFMLMLPTLTSDPRLKLIAAADPRAAARQRFAAEFGARTYETVEELCGDAEIEAIYIATPHQFHAAHAIAAARAGKHMLIEKPMAVTLDECESIVAAARAARIHVVIGHSHSFDAPIAEAKRLIDGGAYGRLRLVTAFNFTDFLYRPRRPEELDTAQGGGVIFNQGAHQIDVARLLAGGLAQSVRAVTGRWDAARPTEGAYAAFVTFADGAAATLTYSGYAHFDSDEFCDWIGESGLPKSAAQYGAARRALRDVSDAAAEAALKMAQTYGGAAASGGAAPGGERLHAHFGVVIASCEKADLRPLPGGIMIYEDAKRHLHKLPPPAVPRAAVIDELYDAAVLGALPLHSGEWGLATLELCHAILRSAAEGREIRLARQVALPAGRTA
jgi:phthalate 4,5-cis-dihydrodiol dehydrogenase